MKIRLLTLLFAIVLSLSLSVLAHAEDGNIYEQELLQLINQARANPLEMAASLGMDPDQVLSDFPELYDILTQGLPPLIFNGNLYAAATAHTLSMLENNYYSHDSLDGSTFDDRIVSSGYVPLITGESLGFIAFGNFIKPDEAIRLMFENMFQDELDPSRPEKRNILDPELKEVGIGFGSGTFEIGGSDYNVYLVTCDFAASAISVLELELLELINQAREDPLAVAASLGMDTDQILKDLPDLSEILTEGLPPLTFNGNLYAAAFAHALDMLENNYFSYDSPDGRNVDDRIREQGYLPLVSGEVIGSLAISFMEPADGARMIFGNRFKDELDPDRIEERNILNPVFKEAGISFRVVDSREGEDLSYTYHLLVCDFGASIMEEAPSLKGLVYDDMDKNGLYSPGEGIPEIAVTIEGSDSLLNLFTNAAGGFEVSLEPGLYRVIALIDDDPMKCLVELEEENRAVWFKVE